MKKHAFPPSWAVLAFLVVVSCASPAASGGGDGGDNWWEGENNPPDPADYGIDLNAINKKEVSLSASAANYQSNPLLGYEWQPGSGGGFTYFFKQDGTVSSTHHCELLFDNQFSYVFYRNFLVTYGAEMATGDRLEARTIHSAGSNGEIVLFKRNITTGSVQDYDIYERGTTDAHPSKGATQDAPTSPPYTPFLGSWTAVGGASYTFSNNGTYTVTTGGISTEYGYLVRKDKFVTVTPGEMETVGGISQWKTFPCVNEQTFSAGGTTITLGGSLTLVKTQGVTQ